METRRFEIEYPEAAKILMNLYAKPPQHYIPYSMRYLIRRWHFTHKGECLEHPHGD